MSQLSTIISQINNLTGYNVPTSSNVVISQGGNPVGSGSVNQIVGYINSLTGYNIPSSSVQFISGSNVAGPVIVYTPYPTGGTIPTTGIQPGAIIKSEHLLRIINALNGVNEDIIIISGSLLTSGSNVFNGSLSLPFIPDGNYLFTSGGLVVASTQVPTSVSASHAINADTASYVNPLYQDVFISSSGNSALSIHGVNQGPWAFRIFNDSHSIIDPVGEAFGWDNGNFAIGSEIDNSIEISTNGNFYTPTLVISSSGVTINPSLTVGAGGITGSLYGTASNAISSSYALTASYALNGGGGVAFPYSGSAVITGSLLVSGSGIAVTGSLSVSGSIAIGAPAGGYSGFFTDFTSTTALASALNEISTAFNLIVPAQANALTSTALVNSNSANVFTGYIAAGLNPEWYVGNLANTQVTSLTTNPAISLVSNPGTAGSASYFRAGSKFTGTDYTTLVGGVTASRAVGTGSFLSIDAASLANGPSTGPNSKITINNIAVYNNFWSIAKATLSDTMATGSYKYYMTADNTAGTSNTTQLYYVGGAIDFPAPTVTNFNASLTPASFVSMSGIAYVNTGTFTASVTASNLFNPAYSGPTPLSFTSPYITTITTGSAAPSGSDVVRLTITAPLLASKTSGQSLPVVSVTGSKPTKANTTAAYTVGSGYNYRINSYASHQSTLLYEPFLDEYYRYSSFTGTTWSSGSALIDGNLQVQNGRLVNGNAAAGGDYSGFTAAQQYYYRFFKGTSNATSGVFTFTSPSSISISPWGGNTANTLEIAFVKFGDQNNYIWDLGRALNNNTGTNPSINGVYQGAAPVWSAGSLIVNWSLGSVTDIGTLGVVLVVKYNGANLTTSITSITYA